MSQNTEDNRKKWPGDSSNFTVNDKQVDGKKVWQPPSDYAAGGQYHKVHATTFRSGHSFEVDETDGGRRIRVTHADGSYMEMQHDGSVVHRIEKDGYEVVSGDKNVRVKGATNIYVSGDVNAKVDGSMTVEVGGTTDIKSGGAVTIKTPHLQIEGSQVTHNGVNIGDTHVHGGVTPGGALTATPQ